MISRSHYEQLEHDEVVSHLRSVYSSRGFATATNPGPEKNQAISGLYPDVIVQAGEGYYLFEVETAECLFAAQTLQQCRDYDSTYTTCWYLVVPLTSLSDAQRLIASLALRHVRLVTYERSARGAIFYNLPGVQ